MILTPVLNQVARVDDLSEAADKTTAAAAPPMPPISATPSSTSCSNWTVTSTPNVIRVYSDNPDHGADYHIHTVDFQSYVQHVLPREWQTGWPQESLRAGAMAAKMYGWYHVNNWRGGETSEGCYDVDSLPYNYQVWDPALGYPDTDKAVRDTWDYYLVYASSGTPYSTNFGSGNPGDACGDLDGQSPPWMSQFGTVTCANQDKPWYDILLNRYYTSANGSPASTLVHGPFATASGAEGLTGLSPYITPSSNSQVTVHWTGTSGIDYELCFDGALTGEFSIYCEYIGNGIGSWNQATPVGDQSYLYVRLLACQSGYCSAIRAGGIENRALNGNNFYGTASYIWPYSVVYVGERNYSAVGSGVELWDGVPGFGGARQVVCNVFPSSNCGPDSWVASSLSWYVTVTQSIGNPADTAPIRVVPNSVGE